MVTRPGPMSQAVTSAIGDAEPATRDAAAVALLERYAQLMDEAQGLADDAAETWAELDPEDAGGRRRLAKLEAQLAAHNVASDLGPKLLAALSALGMTLAGRGAKSTKENTDGPVPGAGALDELRARRDSRPDRAAPVDAAVP